VRLLLLGAPGSGKGTQAERLAEHFEVAHLATGEMLRAEVEADTAIGREVAAVLASGDLVPDEIIEELLRPAFVTASQAGGFVLDGFPRTLHQAERAFSMALDIGATLQAVVHLDVPAEELLRRALSRHQGRTDDTETTIRHRIEVYDRQTRPLTDYYEGRGILVTIDGTGEPDDVFDAVLKELTA
jgi:adenylate kinase